VCQWVAGNRIQVVAPALKRSVTLLKVRNPKYLLPLVGVMWWGSLSDSLGTSYLDTEFVDKVPGNGGRNSSTLAPITETACRGDEVVDDVGAVTLVSFDVPAWARDCSGIWSTG
jgi:hypothetical protein